MHKHERPEPEARGAVDDPQHDHPTAPAPVESVRPEVAEPLAAVIQELAAILPGLKLALEHCARAKSPVERLALRLEDVADALGMSRRAIERERAAGRFPAPDAHFGKSPVWLIETVRDWLSTKKGGN